MLSPVDLVKDFPTAGTESAAEADKAGVKVVRLSDSIRAVAGISSFLFMLRVWFIVSSILRMLSVLICARKARASQFFWLVFLFQSSEERREFFSRCRTKITQNGVICNKFVTIGRSYIYLSGKENIIKPTEFSLSVLQSVIKFLVYTFQILIRVYEIIVNNNGEVKVRTGCNTAGTNLCNGFALCYLLANVNEGFRAVEIFGLYATAVVNGYVMTGTSVVRYGFNRTGKCCYNAQTVCTANIQTSVVSAGTCSRCLSRTEVGVDCMVAGKRPDDIC